MPDILIRGMEMPKTCADCSMCYDMMECTVSPLRFWHGRHENEQFDFCKERHPDCPLLELPAHGDLILKDDAIVAVKLLSDLYPEYRKILAVLWDQIKDLTVIIPESEEVTNDPQP